MINAFLKKIKRIITGIYSRLKYLLKNDIPVLYSYIFKSRYFMKDLESKGIVSPKPYMWKTWHLGYEYYIGTYKNSKVFIKYNCNSDWIRLEADNINYIENKSEYLKNRIPVLYMETQYKNGRYIVERYYDFNPIIEIESFAARNCKKIIMQLYEILEEFQRINFKHLDLNSKNIYLDDEDNVYIIDFGFSDLNRDTIDLLGNPHMKEMILSNLNTDTRLDVGVIDDAYSLLQVAKVIDVNLITDYYDLWLLFNKASGKRVFDGRDLKPCYENK